MKPHISRKGPLMRAALAMIVCSAASLCRSEPVTPVQAVTETQSVALLSRQWNGHTLPMLLVDPDSGAILDANNSAARFYGYDVDNLSRMNVSQLNVLDESAIAAERQRALKEERNYFLFPHRLADGRIHTVEVYSAPVELPSGKRVLLSIILDATGRKLAEGELLQYKNRLEELVTKRTSQLEATHQRIQDTLQGAIIFQAVIILLLVVALLYRRQVQREVEKQKRLVESMLDSSLQFMGLLDTEGRLLVANRTALSRFGLDRDQVAGRYFWDTPWWAHSEAEQARLRRALLLAAMGEESRYETSHSLRDGAVVDVDFSIRPVHGVSGKVVNLLVEGRDITSRKQAEAQLLARRRELQEANDYLKTLIDALPDTLMELDANGRIYQFRSPLADFPAPPPGGWTIRDALPDEAHRAVLDALAEARDSGTSRGRRFSLEGAVGHIFELSVSRLPDSEDLPQRYVVLARETGRPG